MVSLRIHLSRSEWNKTAALPAICFLVGQAKSAQGSKARVERSKSARARETFQPVSIDTDFK